VGGSGAASQAGLLRRLATAETATVTQDSVLAVELAAVPTDLSWLDASLRRSEADVYRDFMPMAEGPSGLIAVVRIMGAESGDTLAEWQPEKIAVACGAMIWIASLTQQPREENIIGGVARNGPNWDTGAAIGVVVLLRNVSGEARLVRFSDQVIERAE
jgi:hypothetical protein